MRTGSGNGFLFALLRMKAKQTAAKQAAAKTDNDKKRR
jgi:hypothetical protein